MFFLVVFDTATYHHSLSTKSPYLICGIRVERGRIILECD
jgi:hypothetical protein